MTRLALSSRQYSMLKMFIDMPIGQFMRIEEAQHYDQRPFRSMLIQKWVAYAPGRGFHVTKTGREAYRRFLSTDIARHNPNAPLTAYFDATAYGLRKPPMRERRSKDRQQQDVPLAIAAA